MWKRESKEIRRNELFKLVWEKPMTKVAADWGLSDVGLAKICRKHDIPVPPRGYWAKKEHGKKLPPKPKLSSTRDVDEMINISPAQYRPKAGSGERLQGLLKAETSFQVDEELQDPHPLVEKAAKLLRATKRAEPYLVPRKNSQTLTIKVTPETLERALCVFDTVIKSLGENDIEVQLDKDNDKTFALVDGERVEISIKEKMKCQLHEATQQDYARRSRDWSYEIPRYDYMPTGQLMLCIENAEYLGVRQNWSDGKVQRIENCIENDLLPINWSTRGLGISLKLHRRRSSNEEQTLHRRADYRDLERSRSRDTCRRSLP